MTFDSSLESICLEYRSTLERNGLLLSGGNDIFRKILFIAGIVFLVGIPAIRFINDVNNGQFSTWYLLAFSGLNMFALYGICFSRTTGYGDQVLADLRTRYSALRKRGPELLASRNSGDATLLLAVYGPSALSSESFLYLQKLFPTSKPSSWGNDYSFSD